MDVGGGPETSFFEDKLPYASSPPPPPATPLGHVPATVTPLKRKIEVDGSPDADSPALSRLAKRMARSSMSSPQVPEITDVAMADGGKDRYAGGEDTWEDDQEWGDDAMLEWNAPFNTSQGVQDRTFERATGVNFQPPQSPQQTDLDWSMGPPDQDKVEGPALLAAPRSRIVASPVDSVKASASPRPDTPKDRIQALLDRGMPDYASWDLPDLQVCRHRDRFGLD